MTTATKRSPMVDQFRTAPRAEIQRASFDRSHGLKTTFNASDLVPIFVDEALPGDTFNVRMTAFGRMATPIHPIMDNLFCETFFFAIPYRLVWDNWQKFNGEQDNPGDSTDFTIPVANVSAVNEGTLADYFGIPVGTHNLQFSCLHHRAYNLVYNEWFRDQNLQDSLPVDKSDGPTSLAEYIVRKRGKRADYFTTGLPWPQKGQPVTIPIGQRANVLGIGFESGHTVTQTGNVVKETGGGSRTYNNSSGTDTASPAGFPVHVNATASGAAGFPDVYADLTTATATTINELRQAFQIQRMLERDARGGTRYTEVIRSHFGVVSPDQRLQRPEYLGGGRTMINVNPVAQTEASNETSPQGNLSAYATFSANGHGFTKSFTEHCLILGLVNVRADLTYQQGLDRMFSRQTRYDFFWPALAHLGEQAILNKEIYVDGSAEDNNVFAYQERYAEYRFKPSRITGRFRSSASASLDPWHLAQNFANRPVLNASFIEDNAPVDRVVAVQSEPQFLFDAYFRFMAARPMPMYGTPGLIDHF